MKDLFPYYRYLKLCRGRYALGILFGIINGLASGFGMAFIIAKLLPLVFTDEPKMGWALVGVVLLIPAMAVLRGVSAFLSVYWVGYCNHRITLQIRRDVMGFMQQLSLSFYQKNRTGKIMARLIDNTSRISTAITEHTAEMVRQPVTILGAIGFIVYLTIQSSGITIPLLVIAILPVCIYFIRAVGQRINRREQQMINSEGSLNTIVHEHLESAKEIRAFNLHDKEADKFDRKARRQFSIRMRLLAYKNVISPSIEIIASIGVAGAILCAAFARIPLEAIVPLLMALYACYQPFKKVGISYASIQRATLAVQRLNSTIYNSREKLESADTPEPCGKLREAIRFHEVSFAYSKGSKALRRVSVEIRRGEVIALVGRSGSGKSTFCNLLCRFHDPSMGEITYDGINLKQFDENEYRKHIAIVPQDSFLFADTIMNNIRVGRLDATDEEVMDAARKANAHDFIEDQPDGYETMVAERGISLSGGQRQRIAIARAFLRNAEILILDEATSAIDARSERQIQRAFSQLFKDRTVIIIAHRYSTIRLANRILLFRNGRIQLDGSEETLEAESGFFRSLKASQTVSSPTTKPA